MSETKKNGSTLVGDRAVFKTKGDIAVHMSKCDVLDENGNIAPDSEQQWKAIKARIEAMTGKECDDYLLGTDRPALRKVQAKGDGGETKVKLEATKSELESTKIELVQTQAAMAELKAQIESLMAKKSKGK